MVLFVTCPDGKDGPDWFRSEESEKRIVGLLKRVRNLGCAFCNCTIRTLCICFGRRRSMADFNPLVTSAPINKDNARQTTNARVLNPPTKSVTTPTAINNGLQISLSLTAAMNKSRNGLVHCWLIKGNRDWSMRVNSIGLRFNRYPFNKQTRGNHEARMTSEANDECQVSNIEGMTNPEAVASRQKLRMMLSSFVIRHSSFGSRHLFGRYTINTWPVSPLCEGHPRFCANDGVAPTDRSAGATSTK